MSFECNTRKLKRQEIIGRTRPKFKGAVGKELMDIDIYRHTQQQKTLDIFSPNFFNWVSKSK